MNTPRYIDHPPCHVVPNVSKREVQLQIGAYGPDYRVLFMDEENARRLAAQLVNAADEIAGGGE